MSVRFQACLDRSVRRLSFGILGLAVTMALVLTGIAAHAEEDLDARFQEIDGLLREGKYKDAEPVVRKCLEQVPRDLAFLAQLDTSLNGQGRHADADQIRDQILEVWEKDRRQEWIAKGSPKGEATWGRMMVPSKDYWIIGSQYFTPEVIGAQDEPHITVYYKVLLWPREKSRGTRLMKLEMSELERPYDVLREQFRSGGGKQLIPYGSRKPELHDVVRDVSEVLEGKRQLEPLASTEVHKAPQ